MSQFSSMEFISVINILSCFCALSILFLLANEITATGEVVFAVNCGGPDHTDLNGVHYQADKLSIGTASDFGRQLAISRVPPLDQTLYQTERYHLSNFAYDIPIKEDGDYVLVLKFSEVYFQGPKLKVFDVHVNSILAVKQLDIYDKVGKGVAHDEYIPFTINKGQILVETQLTRFPGNLRVEFVKGYDNPKINAIVVMKGNLEDVPKLPPLPGVHQDDRDEPDEEEGKLEDKPERVRKTSGPRAIDPYASDESSLLLPVLIALGVFIPTLFCLCKL
mgnify:FL=1